MKHRTVSRLLDYRHPDELQVITRFNLDDFAAGVSDIKALRLMLDKSAQIRGIRNLHSKLYLFGRSRAVLTSANLTDAALMRNHEFGFVSSNAGIVERCHQYFDDLWDRAGSNLDSTRLEAWESQISRHLASGARPATDGGFGDHGIDAGLSVAPPGMAPSIADADQAFVKFFGESHRRADRTMQVLEEVTRSGCHWACTYPLGKRPRAVRDGAIMFMGRMVQHPNDILVYGRAIGMRHRPGRDDASREDLERRSWKAKWPHYIRVHHAAFIAGTLANGVSLNSLMDVLGSDIFVSTQCNVARRQGNTNPRRAYLQQAAVQLSLQGRSLLVAEFEAATNRFGALAPEGLKTLDWPEVHQQQR